MFDKINIGILGAGRIAHRIAATVKLMSCAQILAVASRDVDRATQFANEHSIPKAYGYTSLLEDNDIELVYIATPASHHANHAKMCLMANKHVLCEKPFAINEQEAQDVLQLARERNLLITEAIWPRYMPMAETIRSFVSSGAIGNITSLTCNLGYPVTHKERVMNPQLGGGALLEVGIYPLTFALIAFGNDVKNIKAFASLDKNGIDLQESVWMEYEDGRIASFFASIISHTDRIATIHGSEGYAVIHNINNYERLCVYSPFHELISQIERPKQLTGYEYEILSAINAIKNGQCECPQIPHDEIISTMKIMDKIRNVIGVKYPMEKELIHDY